MSQAAFKHEDFQFGYEIALGSISGGYADAGEVVSTVGRIKDGDADGWVAEWCATADRLAARGKEAADAGHRRTARGCYLRASNYFSTGAYLASQAKHEVDAHGIWARSRECWDAAVDLGDPAGERVEIPYEGTTLPAYVFRAPDAEPGEKRPLVVMNNGSDGNTATMGLYGGDEAAARGYHWMVFDGPGQQAALFRQQLYFRPDWEAVLTPVLDAMVARPDVDADRIAVIGISQAGFWVPRAISFEHRFAAAVIDPGVVDVSTSWMASLPGHMKKQLEEGNKHSFDQEMSWAERFSRSTRAVLHFRGEPFGIDSGSRYDLYQEVLRYRLGDEVKNVSTPVLITNPEDEQFWPGQSQRLYDMLPGAKTLAEFTALEGANRHCEPMAPAVRNARIFDWLDQYLA